MSGRRPPETRTLAARARGALLQLVPWAGLVALTLLWVNKAARDRDPAAGEGAVTQLGSKAFEAGHGRLATAPWQIPIKGWVDIAWRTWREVHQDNLSTVAASVTFYILLAIFPAVAAFVSLFSLFADVAVVHDQLEDLADFVPRDVLVLMAEQMRAFAEGQETRLSLALAISVILSLWAANAGVTALFDGLNVAYDESEKRGYLVKNAVTYACTAGVVVFGTLVTGLLAAAPEVLREHGLIDTWLTPFRWVVLTVLAATAFGILYRFGPSREPPRWRWVRVGAGFAGAAWIGGSIAFSWYVHNVAHYDATYGSLGANIGFIMWIWFSVMVVLIGAELNAEIEHQTVFDSTTGAPRPLGERGAEAADTIGDSFLGPRTLWRWARAKAHSLLPWR